MLVEGRRELARCLDSGTRVETLVLGPGPFPPEVEALVERARARAEEVLHLSERAFARLAYRERPEIPVILVVPIPGVPLERFEPRGEGPLLLLEAAEKPGNLGAVLRSADGAGVSGVVLVGKGADPGNPNALRASLGTLFSVPLGTAEAGPAAAVPWLRTRGYRILATRPEASVPWYQADLATRTAIVFGSEKDGLDPAWDPVVDQAVSIPMLGAADSLNLAQSVTLLAYEALRQRGP